MTLEESLAKRFAEACIEGDATRDDLSEWIFSEARCMDVGRKWKIVHEVSRILDSRLTIVIK